MNDKFKELHDKARQFYLQDEYLDLPLKQMHTLVEEKFAELIVRECIDVVQRTVDGKPVDDLKEHFGVE